MTPFNDILAWGSGLPLWQQEAVRIILASNAAIPRAAIPKLADLCAAEVAGEKTGAKPLSSGDLPLAGAPAAGVTLAGFGLPQNINALQRDQWLEVGPRLTVVFGHNAAGKSGYARILKKAFRARVVEELQPDVRAEKPAGPAAATFEFHKGVKVVWRADAPLAPELASRFAVLDAKSGHAYVVDNQLQIAPQGLDVLPRLVEALDAVKAELQSRKVPAVKAFADGLGPTTAAFAAAQRITAATEPADVLPGLAFTDADAERLEAVRDEVAQLRTPRQLGGQLDGAIKAARTLQLALELRQALTGKKGVAELAELRAAAADAATAAKKVESLASDQKLVKGVGSDAWVGLIEAAAAFVADHDSERCPLCLEKLSPAAQARLDRFWGVVKGEAADLSAAASEKLEERMELLEQIAAEKDEALDALLATVAPHAPLVALSFNGARAAAATTAKKLKAKKPAEGVDASAAIAEVGALLATLNAKLGALQKGNAGTTAEAQRLGAEQQELEAKRLLAGRGKQIEAYVVAARAAARVDAALASIRSQPVTAKSAELNETWVTESYRTRVEAELKRLGFARHLPVLTQQGSKGKVRILALANPKLKAVGPEEVFSEGERTAIAIASFFAELSMTPSPVGLVFDDPIAALDQPTRAKVAERLAAESDHRQVIVFTHDRGFVEELRRFAKDPVIRELRSTPDAVGIVGPWAG